MILIEFEGGSARKFRMEFHPLLTIVEGFNETQRRDLATRIQSVMTGADVGFTFNVDIGGTVQPLTGEAVEKLGLMSTPLENIMRASHLPGITVGAPPSSMLTDGPTGKIAIARAELDKAQKRLEDAESALEKARNPRSPVESSVVDQLTIAHEASRAKVGDLRTKVDALPVHDSSEERDKRIGRLEAIAQAIRSRAKELRVFLDRLAPAVPAREESAQPSATDLARAWLEVGRRLDNEVAQPNSAPRWLVESARRDLEEARERVEELKANSDTFAMPKAQQALVDAQEVWSEIERGEVNSIEELKEERAQIYSQAVALIGHEVDTVDLVQVLRSLPAETPPAPEVNPERDRLQRDLAAAVLDHQDVLHEIRELRSIEIIDPTEEETATRKTLTNELENAELDEAEFGERLAELQVAARRVPLPNPSMIAIVSDERDKAFAELSATNRKVEQLTQAAVREAAKSVTEDPEEVPDTQLDMSGVKQDSVEVFVLSRIAWLRQLGRGESIPLIIDAAFDRLPVTMQLRLLNLLGSVASTVQVIYLASSDTAIDWAKRQNELLAAVVRLERD